LNNGRVLSAGWRHVEVAHTPLVFKQERMVLNDQKKASLKSLTKLKMWKTREKENLWKYHIVY
jgi:hypothetical protein